MVKCEVCMYTQDGKEIEGAMDIPWEPFVTEADDGEHYFCTHICQRHYEMTHDIAEDCWDPMSEEECARRKKVVDDNSTSGNGLGSDYGPFDEE